jgi:hypothetical protein
MTVWEPLDAPTFGGTGYAADDLEAGVILGPPRTRGRNDE